MLGRGTEVKVFFLVLVYVFSIDFFEFSAAILEKGLLCVYHQLGKELFRHHRKKVPA